MIVLPASFWAVITRNQRPQLGVTPWAAFGVGTAPGAGGAAWTGCGLGGPSPGAAGASRLPCGRSRVTGWANPALVMIGLNAWVMTSPVGCAGSTAAKGVR